MMYVTVTLLNFYPNVMHWCALKSTFYLARLIGLPSRKVFNSNMRTHKAKKSGNLEKVLKEKENNKCENQIEVL